MRQILLRVIAKFCRKPSFTRPKPRSVLSRSLDLGDWRNEGLLTVLHVKICVSPTLVSALPDCVRVNLEQVFHEDSGDFW